MGSRFQLSMHSQAAGLFDWTRRNWMVRPYNTTPPAARAPSFIPTGIDGAG